MTSKYLTIKIQSMDDWQAGVVDAMKSAQEGRAKADHSVSFPSYATMHETLAPARVDIIRTLAGQCSLSIHEIALRVGRDVQEDVTRLVNAGVIERDGDGGVRFDYEGLRFDFEVGAAD